MKPTDATCLLRRILAARPQAEAVRIDYEGDYLGMAETFCDERVEGSWRPVPFERIRKGNHLELMADRIALRRMEQAMGAQIMHRRGPEADAPDRGVPGREETFSEAFDRIFKAFMKGDKPKGPLPPLPDDVPF